jgi:uncharacterized protein YbjT (DUF2867 family)
MPEKIIAVMGATGAQGGGLVRAIQKDAQGGFRARALTRNVASGKAKALAALGAEVVEANADDPESLRKAFRGATGAFCVTFFWEHMSPETELAHARAMAEAAKAESVEHAIWSTLEDTRKWVPLADDRMPTLKEKYKVPHFDAKGESDEVFRTIGPPTTNLLTAFYWDNFIRFGMGPRKGPDGKVAITLPMGNKPLSGIAAEDIGGCAYGVFRNRDAYVGKTVGIAGGHLTGTEMAQGLGRALGIEVVYNDVPFEAYRSFDFPGADDMGNMFQFKHDFNDYYVGARSLQESRRLNPGLQDFATWADRNKDRIPVA